MKKITSLVLVLIMILSLFAFTSCGDKRDPLEEYKNALTKINTMTEYDLEIVTEYIVNYSGSTQTILMNEVYRTDGETAYFKRIYDGEAVNEHWYARGVYYSIDEGYKEAITMGVDQYKLNYSISGSDVIFTISDSAFNGKKFKEKDGVYYVNVEVTSDEYYAFSGITINDNAVCDIGFDDKGEIVSFGVKAQYTASGEMIVDVTRTINFKKFRDVASVHPPVNANTFRIPPEESMADKTGVSINDVSITEEVTDLVMIDVAGYGVMLVRLYPDFAPRTVANFQRLVSEKYYDGSIFHRVIKDFMIQGGSNGYVASITGEFTANGHPNNLTHKRGVISMARTNDPNSASSQFFIVHKDSAHLDSNYASFGYVVYGIDVVDAIASVDTDSNDNPTTEVKINSIRFVKVN